MVVSESKLVEFNAANTPYLKFPSRTSTVVFKITILSASNVPINSLQLDAFFSSSCVSLTQLGQIESITKGPIRIWKTYDSIHAKDIGSEHNIITSIRKLRLHNGMKHTRGPPFPLVEFAGSIMEAFEVMLEKQHQLIVTIYDDPITMSESEEDEVMMTNESCTTGHCRCHRMLPSSEDVDVAIRDISCLRRLVTIGRDRGACASTCVCV